MCQQRFVEDVTYASPNEMQALNYNVCLVCESLESSDCVRAFVRFFS